MAVDGERFREVLLQERRRVSDAIAYLHEENPGSIEDETGDQGSVENHLGDAATATVDREVDYTLEENSGHVLAEIDAALKRIEEGTFGRCASCGREIPAERLEALPWTTLCIDCRRRQERS